MNLVFQVITKNSKENYLQSVDNWAKNEPTFKLPCDDMILVKKFAKTHEKPKYSSDNTLVNEINKIELNCNNTK